MRQLIRNARIVTGDGETEPFAGDVLLVGERIAYLGAVPRSAHPGAVPRGAAKGADRTVAA